MPGRPEEHRLRITTAYGEGRAYGRGTALAIPVNGKQPGAIRPAGSGGTRPGGGSRATWRARTGRGRRTPGAAALGAPPAHQALPCRFPARGPDRGTDFLLPVAHAVAAAKGVVPAGGDVRGDGGHRLRRRAAHRLAAALADPVAGRAP